LRIHGLANRRERPRLVKQLLEQVGLSANRRSARSMRFRAANGRGLPWPARWPQIRL
jgi:hypothetical protein